jgi:hypothetical protein
VDSAAELPSCLVGEARGLHSYMRWTEKLFSSEKLFIAGMSILAVFSGALYALATGGYWN